MWGRASSRVGVVAVVALAAPASANTPSGAPPAQPEITDGARTFVAFAGQPAPVRLTWTAVPNVARYRARWTDRGIIVDFELPATATAFERAERTPGRHQLSVVAIDADGRESAPAEAAIEVVKVTAIAPGASDTDAPASGAAFALGATFASPGLSCRLDGEPAEQVVATRPGAALLRCGATPAQPRIEVPIVIAPVIVDGPKQPIERDRTTLVHVTVASVAPIGDRLQVEAIGELDLGDAERTASGFEIAVTPGHATPSGGLIIRAGAVELGRVDLELVDPAPPRPPASELAWFALDAGGQFGFVALPSLGSGASFLGRPASVDDSLTTAPFFGGRVGFFPTRRVGIEVEASLATAGYARHPGVAAVLVTRAQLAVRVAEERPYDLRVVGGAGALSVLNDGGSSRRDVAGAVHYGAAFTVETRPNLWLRLGANHMITSARDAGYAHCVELQLAVVTRLGRRDRGW